MFTYTIRPDGREPYVLVARMRDILKWERTAPKGKRRTAEDLSLASAENAYALAYTAATRQGLFKGTQEEFEETVELQGGDALTPEPDPEEGEGPDPTPVDR